MPTKKIKEKKVKLHRNFGDFKDEINRLKKVKGWAVVDVQFSIVYFPSMYRSVALKWRRENAANGNRLLKDIKVIPVEIIYHLPKDK